MFLTTVFSHISSVRLQGYLAHLKTPPPRTLQKDYAWGPVVALGGGAVPSERGVSVPTHEYNQVGARLGEGAAPLQPLYI